MPAMSLKWATGLTFIVIVCMLWTGASYLTQFIYGELSFQSPFLFTYLSSSFFALYLPFWQVCVRLGWVTDPPSRHGKYVRRKADGRTEKRSRPTLSYMELQQDISDHGHANATIEMTAAASSSSSSSSRHSTEEGATTEAPIPSAIEVVDGYDDGTDSNRQKLPQCVATFVALVAEAVRSLSLRPIDTGSQQEEAGTGTPSQDSDQQTDYDPTMVITSGKTSTLGFTHSDMLSAAIVLSPLWFLANCMYNYALLYTSVESSTVISNLSGGFTLLFSWLCGIEQITFGKVCGVSICFVGVALVTLHDTEAPPDAVTSQLSSGGSISSSSAYGDEHGLVGDVMAVCGAVGYGLYTTAMRLKVTDDESASMQLLLGYMGVVNAVSLLPVLIFMFAFDLGNVRSLTLTALAFCFISGFFDDVISDYLWGRSVLLTSPTVATVGLTLTIPMAIVVDLLLGNMSSVSSPLPLVGAGLVVAGFVVVNVGCESCCAGTGTCARRGARPRRNTDPDADHLAPCYAPSAPELSADGAHHSPTMATPC